MPAPTHPIQRWLVLTAALIALVLVPAPSHADDAARATAFVTERADQVQQTLSDGSLSEEERADRFAEQMRQIADIPRIAQFVLGGYARGLSEEEIASFADAYEGYALQNFQSNLANYADAEIVIRDAIVRKPGDVIVRTQVHSDRVDLPLDVNWRVLLEPDPKLVDVEVEGAWLNVGQRSEVSALIRSRGSVAAAAEEFRRRADRN